MPMPASIKALNKLLPSFMEMEVLTFPEGRQQDLDLFAYVVGNLPVIAEEPGYHC